MRYRGLDLNLLVALDALLKCRSVSEAARQVHITQPAMSAALSRLRLHYEDPLLVHYRGVSQLTPLADSLVRPVRAALDQIDQTIIAAPPFDASYSTRTFRILAADSLILGLLAKPLRLIAQDAPQVGFELVTPGDDGAAEQLKAGDVDLLVVPEFVTLPDYPSELLIEEEHCVVVCAERQIQAMDIETFAVADHVEVFLGTPPKPYLPDQLFARSGLTRRVTVKLDSFLLVPEFIVGTDRIGTFPGMTSKIFSRVSRVKQLPPPFPLPPVRIVMQWHERSGRDLGLHWLKARIAEGARASWGGHKSHLYRLLPKAI